ncbi:MAG: hypothetical protein ACRDIU_06060 [Actinomycetota bacterium]
MAMAARAARYTPARPRPVRRPAPAASPARRAVPATKQAARTSVRYRPQGLAFAAAILFAVGGFIFGLVTLNIYIAQSSFRIGELEKNMEQQMAQARQMRVRIAEAESPVRLAEAAAKLGLVRPDQREYLSVTGPAESADPQETSRLREFAVSSAVTGRPGRA